jgi:hypothetical protein
MQQSVSMQNVFNDNLVESMKTHPAGQLVTSVSMYNLCDESADKSQSRITRGPGEKDEFSMRSWHPERDSGLTNNGGLHQDMAYDDPRNMGNYNQPSPGCTGRETRPESQRPRTNRGPVQRRLDANRQTNNSVNTSPSKIPFKSMYSARNNLAISDELISQEQTVTKERNHQNKQSPSQQQHQQLEQYSPYENDSIVLDKNRSQEPKAPSRRKKERNSKLNENLGIHSQSNPSLQTLPLSHAQSNMSLHSVISTATTIVEGCAETEI